MDPIPEDVVTNKSIKKSPTIFYVLAVVIVLLGAGILYLVLQKSSKDNVAASYSNPVTKDSQIEKTPQLIQPTTTTETDLQSVDTNLSTIDENLTSLDKDINDESIDLSE